METLRTIDFSQKHFECGGKKFYVKDSLSFARYREMQKLNLEFGYSATFHDIFKHIREAWDLLNALKLAEAAVVLHNIMYGVVSLENKDDPALRLCALFIDEEGEDPTIYDEGKMREKIKCWGQELDTLPFFQLASNLVNGWMQIYKDVSQSGLKKEENQEIPL
jgi:hypothetical protein